MELLEFKGARELITRTSKMPSHCDPQNHKLPHQTVHHQNKQAQSFLTSLCRKDGKPPFGQDKAVDACSTEKDLPQAQSMGTLVGIQPYMHILEQQHHERLPYM